MARVAGWPAVLIPVMLTFLASPEAPPPRFDAEVSHLLGRVMPEWELERWLDGQARSLASLRGQVVFIRWFAMPTCPFCTRSAETLINIDDAFKDRGLRVIGIYHHKEDRPPLPDDPEVATKAFGFRFPRARHIHLGGALAEGPALDALCDAIEQLLAEGDEVQASPSG
ncbi:MAG: redoxin domain-containing protein [Deltaproteobacteria bacterium]|nr:redoxin domain-containing protein [Deltaproteobacteria bacterium]